MKVRLLPLQSAFTGRFCPSGHVHGPWAKNAEAIVEQGGPSLENRICSNYDPLIMNQIVQLVIPSQPL